MLQRLQLWNALDKLDIRNVGRFMLLSCLVGMVSGIGAVAFYVVTNFSEFWILDQWAGFHPPMGEGASASEGDFINSLFVPHRWFLFLVPAVGGLFSGWLVFTFAPEAEGHGTDGALDSFHNQKGRIRARVPYVKALASIATIATGGSAGREGPIAQIGAGFGSFLADRLKLGNVDRRTLLLAGMAGGIGATFHAPLGGALFAVEVLYQDPEFEHEGLIPCIIASIVAYSFFGVITGWKPLLATPNFQFRHPSELVFYFVLAILCAVMGRLYVKTFYGVHAMFERLHFPKALKPALGGLMLGLLAMAVPQVLGSGYGWVQAALYGKMALWLMLLLALAKIVATSLTISSGGSGGVFAPSLVIGAMVGGTFGAASHALFPTMIQDPRVCVLLGMAGFFAGVANTPIATLIMVSELTGNYALLAPLMLVCVVAMVVYRRNTIYQKQVRGRVDSPAHLGDLVIDVLEGITVGELAELGREPTLIPEGMPLRAILEKMAGAAGGYYPVINDDGRLSGIFSVNDIRRILHEEIPAGLIRARDIAMSRVVTTSPSESLTGVMRKLSLRGLEEIPVVDDEDPGKVLFMLSRRVVLARYASELERQKGVFAEA
ncbi:chloride channel protein [Syntrophotalea acetylenivorans]|uniref:Chloride channel protein n=1 Tax=Syntrophotalea acetylenivorans TaxID=1842532 RepID=A0A1L3GLR9_9BACT|nr:chloride channel protein [Syntrophotalea acetylenivorans]APG26887.1 chloride channel protein [Syntrophotalea acetylenivorans]